MPFQCLIPLSLLFRIPHHITGRMVVLLWPWIFQYFHSWKTIFNTSTNYTYFRLKGLIHAGVRNSLCRESLHASYSCFRLLSSYGGHLVCNHFIRSSPSAGPAHIKVLKGVPFVLSLFPSLLFPRNTPLSSTLKLPSGAWHMPTSPVCSPPKISLHPIRTSKLPLEKSHFTKVLGESNLIK